jgi:hypothetical protein
MENARLRHRMREMSERIKSLRGRLKEDVDILNDCRIADRGENLRARILEVLTKGEKSLSELTRKTSSYEAGERRAALSEMLKDGKIQKKRRRPEGRGATATVYSLPEPIQVDPFTVCLPFSVDSQWRTVPQIEASLDIRGRLEERLKELFSADEIDYKERATATGKKTLYRIANKDD